MAIWNRRNLFSCFKVYLLDVGLLGAMTSLSEKVIIEGDHLFKEFKGSFAENVVMQTLATFGEPLYYWRSEGRAELDGVIQCGNNIYPLEIQSGLTGKKKSLRIYADKYKPTLLLRISPNHLRKDGQLLNCPFYALEGLKQWIALSE